MKAISSFFCGTLLISLVFGTGAFAQRVTTTTENDYHTYPYWKQMMQDPNVNFFEVQKAFYTYWQGRATHRGDGYKPFRRWEAYWETRINPDGTFPQPGQILREYTKFAEAQPQKSGFKSGNAQWIELGPRTRVDIGGYCGVGRINAIVCPSSDTSTVYVGAPSGGLWKTADGGKSWNSLTDEMPSLGTSSISIHPTNNQEILVGTGDRDHSDARGIGVIRTTDGGATWQLSNTGMGELTVGMMDRNSTDPNFILAATSNGIYKSIDGGKNWARKSTINTSYKDIKFKPGSGTVAYASTASGNIGFFRTEDAGETWIQVPDSCGAPVKGRIVIAVTPAAPNLVYLAVGDPFCCYASQDEGKHFAVQATTPNVLGYSSDGSDNGGQTWYDLCIVADPVQAQIVYVGGINLWRSDNSGKNWRIIGHWTGSGANEIHADQHTYYINPVNNRLYAGNDGGIYYSDNKGTSWKEISVGLGIGQIYRLGVSATNPHKIMAGFQDNGSATYTGNEWITVGGGDGMEAAVDPQDYAYSYSTLYYGDITQYIYNGYNRKVGGQGVGGINEEGAWVTPFIVHPDDGNTMIAGYKNIWITHDLKNSSAITWKKLSNNLGDRNDMNISSIELSPAQPKIFYFTRSDRKLYRTDDITRDAPVWIDLSSNLPYAVTPTALECHPFDPLTLYAGINRRVYKSTDKGQTWTNISGTLPQITINTIYYDQSSNEGLYVGTDAGIYFKDATMTDWVFYNTNLPLSVEAYELEAYYDHLDRSRSRLRVATFGRGLWESPLAEATPILPATFLTAEKVSGKVNLYWNAPFYPQYVTQYKIFRNNILYGNTTSPYYSDNQVETDKDYTYYVVAEYANSTDAAPSNSVSVILTNPVTLPYFVDFEKNSAGWISTKNTCNWKYGNQTDLGISGNNGYFYGITGSDATVNNAVTDCLSSPVMDLSQNTASGLALSFKYCHLRTADMGSLNVVYRTSKDSAWTIIQSLDRTHSVNWTWDSIHVSLPNKALSATTEIGFLFENHGSNFGGAGVDDIQIAAITQSNNIDNPGFLQSCRIYPNPNHGVFQVEIVPKKVGDIEIQIISMNGQVIKEEHLYQVTNPVSKSFNLRGQAKGTYQILLKSADGIWSDRFTIQ